MHFVATKTNFELSELELMLYGVDQPYRSKG